MTGRGRYAANTEVTADRSRSQIEAKVRSYGADQFMYGWDDDRAVVTFRITGRYVRFVLPMPDSNDPEFTRTQRGQARSEKAASEAWEKATRQRWRALLLNITAKLEAVEIGLASFDQEFMANVVLPDGLTVGDHMSPQIERAYETGTMPALLPALGPGT